VKPVVDVLRRCRPLRRETLGRAAGGVGSPSPKTGRPSGRENLTEQMGFPDRVWFVVTAFMRSEVA